jgi:aspartate racemase
MKTIGLIGGMSWESTVSYYRLINETVKERLGGLHSARCVLYSVDFAEVEALQRAGHWTEATEFLLAAARSMERAGADLLLLCTNTMHKVAVPLQAGLRIPLLHIADATAQDVLRAGIRRVGLLGTRFTMEEDFYRDRLLRQFGLEAIVPESGDRGDVHRIIFDELCLGRLVPDSRVRLREVLDRLARQGAEGIILGCTELGLLLTKDDSPVPLFDTTQIHARAAVDLALRPDASSLPCAQ